MASQVYCFAFCKFFYVSAAVVKASAVARFMICLGVWAGAYIHTPVV